ncbi:MAG: diaminopimelate decarboxylase [Candidatus Azobacteroides pseudotrichonymphae]|jgi:diaminopimelate decarboxylase|nr:diaminopimelate decarboxylase [Bacteroidales bacterium OttesenSCG-928-I14]GMO34854.1 MAG: diaminopimelate decarboxylase [Candidatus Azobacteroides pseudotrichonymphae]
MQAFPIEKFRNLQTPFYFYDIELLRKTLQVVVLEAAKYDYHIHYAVKANKNPRILSIIREMGLGADCVSGGEIETVLNEGFSAEKVVFAGVGKTDWEINLGLEKDIFCFNVESIPELVVINHLACAKNTIARVALRINPEIDSHTHHYITTGIKDNKFGINLDQLDRVLDMLSTLSSIQLVGIHFHIGSQIMDLTPFRLLCSQVNELQQKFIQRGIFLKHINFGGGLGIDYENPDENPIPSFREYFNVFRTHFFVLNNQQIHFELGRSIVGQCGNLISKVLYVKEGSIKRFVILDAGFTELIRPAFYESYHVIENLSLEEATDVYDVVGPICESSDCFAKQRVLKKTYRGDIIAIRSAGAYGEVMASQYNCRQLPKSYFSDC